MYSGGEAPPECTYTPEQSTHIVFLHHVNHCYTNLFSSIFFTPALYVICVHNMFIMYR
jgi:hypothetical protein